MRTASGTIGPLQRGIGASGAAAGGGSLARPRPTGPSFEELLLWGSVTEGQLTLSNGTLTLTRLGDPVFSVPVGEARFRIPKLYFGLGMKLSVRGESYRPWFVPSLINVSGVSSDGAQLISEFDTSDMSPARDVVRKWEAALSTQAR